jgi:acyl-CoA thioesterase FadM
MSGASLPFLDMAVARRDLGLGTFIRPHRYFEWAQFAHEQLAGADSVPDPKLLWVYARHTARWHRPAGPISRVRFRTWLVAAKSPSAIREFSADDAETGARLFDGQARSVALDRETMRPATFQLAVQVTHDGQPQRLIEEATVPEATEPLGSFVQHVEADDLDFNQHVNNATYLRWATNALHRLRWDPTGPLQPLPFISGCEIRYLRSLQMGASLRIDIRAVPQPGATRWALDFVDVSDGRLAAAVTVVADEASGAE